MLLQEKYRPRQIDDIIGQDKAIAMVRRLIDRPCEFLWIEGNSGLGKTSLALAIANEKGCERAMDLIHIPSARELTVDKFRELEIICQGAPWGPCRIILIDEAQGLRAEVKERLLGLIETLAARPQRKTWVIFTCMEQGGGLFSGEGEMPKALARRVKLVKLTNQGVSKVFAKRAHEIAEAENLNGQPEAAYLKLAERCKNSFGLMLQEIDRGMMLEAA